MKILAVDPGNVKSAFAIFDSKKFEASEYGIEENETLKFWIEIHAADPAWVDVFLIEQIKSYGMPVGDTVFETCVWIGRFMEAFGAERCRLVPRKKVVSILCNSAKANDSHVRRAVLDQFSAVSSCKEAKEPALGTKKHPGPLYGASKDMWSALALALIWGEHSAQQSA